jgi:hypothetical protein
MKECPACHLANPNSGLRCDCGYDFRSGIVKASYLSLTERRPIGKAKIGMVSFVGDIAVFFCMLYTTHAVPMDRRVTLTALVVFGGVPIWRWGRFLALRWHKHPALDSK